MGMDRDDELNKIRTLKEAINATGVLSNDHRFPILGGLDTSFEAIKAAEKKLNAKGSRLEASLFWFYTGNLKTDSLAFTSLDEGKVTDAFNIWERMTHKQTIDVTNASAFHNLGTLYLSGALDKRFSVEENLRTALALKLKFLESYFVHDFLEKAIDKHFRMGIEDLQRLFLWKVLHEAEKYGLMRYEQFVAIIMEHSFSAKQDFLFEVIQKYS